MKKVHLLLLSVILSLTMATSAFAGINSTDKITLYKELLGPKELQEFSDNKYFVNSNKEINLTSYYNAKIDKNNILSSLSLSSDKVEAFYAVEYEDDKDIEYESRFDNGAVVSYDKNMDIVAYSNFSSNSISKRNKILNNKNTIEMLKENYNIDDSYVLTITGDDNGDIIYYWKKVDNEGFANIYDALSISFDGTTNEIVTFNRFDNYAEKSEVNISEEKAKNIALDLKDEFHEVTSCEKEYIKPNSFWSGNEYNPIDVIKLVYKIIVDNTYVVNVDVETGEIIGGDMIKSVNHSGTYAYNGFPYAKESRQLADTYLAKLGYINSSKAVADSGLRSKVYDFVRNDSSAYGLYIDCHGSTTTLSTQSTQILKTSEVKGNWHFVFLDACNTASNSNWSNAFKINSNYSKRAFLGWSNTVSVGPAYEFCRKFWPETYNKNHSDNIRDAARWAARQVEGNGTTPIKFYGDSDYDGRAY